MNSMLGRAILWAAAFTAAPPWPTDFPAPWNTSPPNTGSLLLHCGQKVPPMSAPDIRAMEDMLDHLRAKKAQAEEQLKVSEVEDPDLELDIRRIEGRIDVLEEMLREAGQ